MTEFFEPAIKAPGGMDRWNRIKPINLAAIANQNGPAVTTETAPRRRKATFDWTKGEPSARAVLGELSTPRLVANGTHHVMAPSAGSFAISQEAPRAKLILCPERGHGFLFDDMDRR